MPYVIDQPEPMQGNEMERIAAIQRYLLSLAEDINRNFDSLGERLCTQNLTIGKTTITESQLKKLLEGENL